MLHLPVVWSIASRFPALFTGRALHHAALHAAGAGAAGSAEQLFERTVDRYRMELEVEGLARLRVHQLVTRARAAGDAGHEAELLLEAAQRLARLEQIESFDPPFAMVAAATLFETGLQRPRHGSGDAADAPAARTLRKAA